LHGGADNDVLRGGSDDDTLNGDGGNDALYGDTIVSCDSDSCYLDPHTGADELNGGEGDDDLRGAGLSETETNDLDGGPGNDTLNAEALPCEGPAASCNGYASTAGYTSDTDDELVGGPGTDTFAAGHGEDVVDGRDGTGETLSCGADLDVALRDAGDTKPGCESYNPLASSPPVVSGTPREGDALSATSASWDAAPAVSEQLRWQSCDATGGACADIAGATETSYTPVPGDIGRRLRVVSRADNGIGGPQETASGATEPVAAREQQQQPGVETANDGQQQQGGQQQQDQQQPDTNPVTPDRDARAPLAKVVVRRQKLAAVLKKGLAFSLTSDEGGAAKAQLSVDAKTAKRLKLGKPRGRQPLVVGRGSLSALIAGKPAAGKVKLSRSAAKRLKKARSVKLRLTVVATDAAGNSATPVTRVVTLKR
jgi:hypothetical protein